MLYYKIIYDNMIIDLIEDPHWVMWFGKPPRFIESDVACGNGIVAPSGNEVYCLKQGGFKGSYDLHKQVEAVRITQEEFTELASLFDENILDGDGNVVPIETAKQNKITILSAECEKKIKSGFDLQLSDGNSHHFSLEITDQLRISLLKQKALAQETPLIHHADNEMCVDFPAQDVLLIAQAMEDKIEYETSYYNSLKNYVLNMTEGADITNAIYGMEIPTEYQSDVFRQKIESNN